jgi:hypothetical protein
MGEQTGLRMNDCPKGLKLLLWFPNMGLIIPGKWEGFLRTGLCVINSSYTLGGGVFGLRWSAWGFSFSMTLGDTGQQDLAACHKLF